VALLGAAEGAIIPPAWANITTNPCAIKSWQLLYWPDTNDCFKIFSKVGIETSHFSIQLFFSHENVKLVYEYSNNLLNDKSSKY